MLVDKIEAALRAAMTGGAGHQEFERRVLRTIKGDVQQAEKNVVKGKSFTEDDVHAVLAAGVATRRHWAKEYAKAGRSDLADNEAREADFIESFLPARLSADETKAVVDRFVAELGATGPKDRGRVIKAVKDELGATGDPKIIAAAVTAATPA